MKIRNVLLNLFLIFQFLTLIPRKVESLKLKCFPTHGSCACLKNLKKITDNTTGEEFKETIRCKPLGKPGSSLKTTQKRSKQICLASQTENADFGLDGGFFGQSAFSEVQDIIGHYSFIKVWINVTSIRGFNIESPLIINTSWDRLHFFGFSLDVSPFEFFDGNGKRVRTCADFKRLNSSSRGYFFQLNFGLDNSSNIVESNRDIYWFALEYVRFGSEPICELIFNNTRVVNLEFNYLIRTFFKTSIPRFVKPNTSHSLNGHVSVLKLKGYYADLTNSLFASIVAKIY